MYASRWIYLTGFSGHTTQKEKLIVTNVWLLMAVGFPEIPTHLVRTILIVIVH